MAEQAQQEPTMEEILSSIRKIIADDEQPSAATAVAAHEGVESANSGDDAFDDLDMSFDELVDDDPVTEDDVLNAISAVDEDNDVFEATDDVEENPVLDDIEDRFESLGDFEDDFVEVAADPAPEMIPEPEYSAPLVEDAPVAASRSIADARTLGAAAGSLGKLLAKVELGEDGGGTNTIDGVVRDLLRPMLKEWLDDNLPGIVEKQVEAEVQRIARMAR